MPSAWAASALRSLYGERRVHAEPAVLRVDPVTLRAVRAVTRQRVRQRAAGETHLERHAFLHLLEPRIARRAVAHGEHFFRFLAQQKTERVQTV